MSKASSTRHSVSGFSVCSRLASCSRCSLICSGTISRWSRIGSSSCQVVSWVPSGLVCVCARLDSWWVCRREIAAAASFRIVSRSASPSMLCSSRLGKGKACACWPALICPSAPSALRAKAGRAWPKLTPAWAVASGVLPGRPGSWATRRSSAALRSPASVSTWPPSRRASRKAPLPLSAPARALASVICCSCGISPSNRSAAPRSPSGSAAPVVCRAPISPSSEPWRFC